MFRDDRSLKKQIAVDNLATRAAALTVEDGKRLNAIDEYAYEIVDGMGKDTSALPERLRAAARDVEMRAEKSSGAYPAPITDDALWLDEARDVRRVADRAGLIISVWQRLRRTSLLPPVYDLPHKAPFGGRVAYVHNTYADAAYKVLSGDMIEPLVRYVDRFAAAAEAVSTGDAQACVLPLGNEKEEFLPGVYELVRSHALCIVSSVRVPVGDGGVTRFGLLTSSDTFLPLCGECRVEFDSPAPATEPERAASFLGLSLVAQTGGGDGYRLAFTGAPDACVRARLYRDTFLPDVKLLGIFCEKNTK